MLIYGSYFLHNYYSIKMVTELPNPTLFPIFKSEKYNINVVINIKIATNIIINFKITSLFIFSITITSIIMTKTG